MLVKEQKETTKRCETALMHNEKCDKLLVACIQKRSVTAKTDDDG